MLIDTIATIHVLSRLNQIQLCQINTFSNYFLLAQFTSNRNHDPMATLKVHVAVKPNPDSMTAVE